MVRELGEKGFPRFSEDGRVVFLVVDDTRQGRLIVESPDGGERIVHELGDARDLHLAGEALPGWVLVSRLTDSSDPTQGRRLAMLSLETGEQRVIDGVVRRIFRWRPAYFPVSGVLSQYRGGPGLSRLAIDQSGALVRWDPETDKLVHVVGGGEKRKGEREQGRIVARAFETTGKRTGPPFPPSPFRPFRNGIGIFRERGNTVG